MKSKWRKISLALLISAAPTATLADTPSAVQTIDCFSRSDFNSLAHDLVSQTSDITNSDDVIVGFDDNEPTAVTLYSKGFSITLIYMPWSRTCVVAAGGGEKYGASQWLNLDKKPSNYETP